MLILFRYDQYRPGRGVTFPRSGSVLASIGSDLFPFFICDLHFKASINLVPREVKIVGY